MKARPPTWQEVRDDEPIYSPEEDDRHRCPFHCELCGDEPEGRKSDVLEWARYGWPATIALAGLMAWEVWK